MSRATKANTGATAVLDTSAMYAYLPFTLHKFRRKSRGTFELFFSECVEE